MKTKFLLFVLFLGVTLSCEKSETQELIFEYTELNDTKLKFEKSSYFILTVDETSSKAKEAELSIAKEKGEIKSFFPKTELSFYIQGYKRFINPSDYLSEIYYTQENSFIIILPNLIVSLKENHQINDIIADYKDLLTLEEQNNNQKYVFKCNVATSAEMIAIVNDISKNSSVDWCEPDMLSDYRTFN